MSNRELSILLTAKGNLTNELTDARKKVRDLGNEIAKTQREGGTVGDDLAGEYRKARQEVDRLGKSVKSTNRDIEQSSKAATTAMGRLNNAITKHQTAIRNAGLVAGAAMVWMGKKSVDAASNLDEAMTKSSVVFAEQSAAVEKWSQSTARSLGLSQRQALEAAGTYGNLFQAFGIGRAEATKMSTSLVGLASDLASFNNTSTDDALEALRSGLSGETEPLKRYGVALTDARMKQIALNLGIYDGTGILDANQKAQAAYAVVMQDTALAQGDFARTSDGLANSQRIATAELENAQAAIGRDLIPIVKDVTKLFASFVGFIGGMPSPLRNVAIAVGAVSIAAMIAGPRILSMAANMKLAGLSVASMKTSMSAAGSFMMGPWGAAIAVAGAGLMLWMQWNQNAKARVDELRESVDLTTGKLNELGQKSIITTLTSEINSADWSKLDELGLGLDAAMEAITGSEKDMRKYIDSVKDSSRALAYQGVNTKAVTNNIYDWWAATSKATDQALLSADAMSDFAGEADTVASAVNDATDQIAALTGAMSTLQGVVSKQKALQSFRKSIKEYVSKPSRDAVYDVISGFDSAFSSFEEGSKAQANFVLNNYAAVRNAVRDSALSKGKKNELLAPIRAAKDEADRLLRVLNSIDNTQVSTNIALTKTVTNRGATDVLRHANGGSVFGAGTATSDSIPAMLSNGEYVIKTAAARQIGYSNLDALNSGKVATDPRLLDRLKVQGGSGTASQPLIGSLTVTNPGKDVDVETAVARAVARGERIKRERG